MANDVANTRAGLADEHIDSMVMVEDDDSVGRAHRGLPAG
jgi:hypothetical protein